MNDENEILQAVANLLARNEATRTQQLNDLGARVSIQGFLLEILYANAFKGDSDGLQDLMDELMQMLRQSPRKTEPTPEEDVIELQALCATHLQRFSESVQKRISSGREFQRK